MQPTTEQVRRFSADVERLKGLDFIQEMAHEVEDDDRVPSDIDPLDPPDDLGVPLLIGAAVEAYERGLGRNGIAAPAFTGCVLVAVSQLLGEYRRARLN